MSLPTPAVIETLDFEAILAETKRVIVDLHPAAAAVIELETEPLNAIAQAFAYREFLYRGRVNDAAAAQLIEYATGADLDHKADFYGIARLPGAPPESDERLRTRLRLAVFAMAGNGTAQAYESRAMAASPGLKQAKATQPTPGSVTVLLWPVDGADPLAVLADVTAALTAENVRILGVPLTVSLAQPVPINVRATITLEAGAPADLPAQLAQRLRAALAAYAAIGKPVPRSWVGAQLYAPGVAAVVWANDTEPPELQAIAAGQYAVAGSITITEGGVA